MCSSISASIPLRIHTGFIRYPNGGIYYGQHGPHCRPSGLDTPQESSGILRNPQESAGIFRNPQESSGISGISGIVRNLRNP